MDTHFDVLILGTGLTQSIVAAALAKAGFKVAHVDRNAYYGGDEASLSHDELLAWPASSAFPHSFGFSCSSDTPLPFSRAYSLSLAPALIPSTGPLISSLILSGVSRYGQFKLLDAVYVYRHGMLNRVPGSKEDVFKARDVSLVDKRKLMRFLQLAAGEFETKTELEGQESRPFGDFMRDKFSLSEDACEAILYALAYCSSSSEPTLHVLQRLRGFLLSVGRYGNSPFLLGHYGGLGELAQGFCRTCAVKGGTYILGRKILSLRFPSEVSTPETARASIQLEDVPDILTADLVIASQDYLASPISSSDTGAVYACGIVVLDHPIVFSSSTRDSTQPPSDASSSAPDTTTTEIPQSRSDPAVVVFAPGSVPGGKATNVVRVLQTGECTLSCPQGNSILHFWTCTEGFSGTSEELLRPYLSILTSSPCGENSQSSIVFSLFYMRREGPAVTSSHARTLVVPSLPTSWTEIADRSAEDAESLFRDAVKILARDEDDRIRTFWPPLETPDDGSGDEW